MIRLIFKNCSFFSLNASSIFSSFRFQAVQVKLGDSFIWQMDDLFPVFHYVVVRSHIQELGSEINFIDDFIEERFKNGEMDIMFTTLKVYTVSCFVHLIRKQLTGLYFYLVLIYCALFSRPVSSKFFKKKSTSSTERNT